MSGTVRFQVSKPSEDQTGNATASGSEEGLTEVRGKNTSYGTRQGDVSRTGIEVTDPSGTNRGGYVVFGDSEETNERDRLHSNDWHEQEKGLALFEEDLKSRPKISRILHNLANYQAGVTPSSADIEKSAKAPQAVKLGTVLGVFLPCIQNIFGVILFIRLSWIVGTAGYLECFFIVFMCCCSTLLTSISMSAIATNGVVPAGGAYFMISRSLGPEFGGAVGILFYLANTVASSMYCLGAVEVFLKYMCPAALIVGTDVNNHEDMANNSRIYGTFLLLILFLCVFLGMRFVSIIAAISLSCVFLSILSIYIGVAVASPERSVQLCYVGDRLMKYDNFELNGVPYCSKDQFISENSSVVAPLWRKFCQQVKDNVDNSTHIKCDPFWDASNVTQRPGIPGLTSDNYKRNIWNHYRDKGQFVTGHSEDQGNPDIDILADMRTAFTILLAIYFPSVTGIMAGSNRSGDLRDASKSIPVGTIGAVLTTSTVYLSCVLFFGMSVEGDLLRDKYGESIGGMLVTAKLAWPHYWVILVGSFLSTIGAGLQSLTGAPRLLCAIAKDGVIPFLKPFSKTTRRGEPLLALFLTAGISQLGILVASLDYVAPILTMFFLMCYGFVNLACALQTLLKSPSWRPRFKFYHWTLSLLGLALCVSLMFISGWYYALIAIAIAIGIYKYIEYKGAENEWGDGIRGLSLSAARYALLKLDENPPHTKNWRPQILMLAKLDQNLVPRYPNMFAFASQLKAGKGLVIAASILEGNYLEKTGEAAAAKQELQRYMREHRVKGFTHVVVSKDVQDGLGHIMQSAGLGGLRHNTIMLGWPYGWRHDTEQKSWQNFVMAVRQAEAASCALLVVKGIQQFPSGTDKMMGTIDVWWIVHDGGLLMLLPFLLRQHRAWKSCKLRIFTVASIEDNSVQMKKDLEVFLYNLRINAQVQVVELSETDVSAYTYGRTVMMEQRSKILREMKLTKKEKEVVIVTDINSPHRAAPPAEDDEEVEPAETSDATNQMKSSSFSFTPSQLSRGADKMKDLLNHKPEKKNVRRMHTAVRINEVIVDRSHDAKLLLINLPGPPTAESGYENYMEYLEVLTEGLERCVLVRGSGREVITIFS